MTLKKNALVTLSLIFVERPTSLQQWFINSSTTCNNSDRSSSSTRHCFLCPTGKSNPCFSLIRSMSNDCGVVSWGPCKGTTIADFFFNVADDSTFRTLTNRQDIAYCKSGFFSTIDESSGMKTFCGDKSFGAEFVAVGVAEDDTSKRCTTGRPR